jgi:hypothetical protein
MEILSFIFQMLVLSNLDAFSQVTGSSAVIRYFTHAIWESLRLLTYSLNGLPVSILLMIFLKYDFNAIP